MDPSERVSKTRSRPPVPAEPERRILITGGAGFLGVNAAVHLVKDGWYVTLLDNLSRPGTERNLKWVLTRYPNRIAFIKEDVRNASALPEHVSNQDAILHLAGQVAVTTSLADPNTDFDINARGTLNVLEAVRLHNHDAPLVFASTNKVYGKLDHNNGPCKEGQPIDFHSPYGCSKGSADQYVRDYARCFQMNTVVLRQSCIYGSHQYGTEDQGWVAHFVHSILKGRPLTIYGDGTQVRDLLDARDLSSLYALAIDKIGITRGEIYNVGGGPKNQRNLLEVIDHIGGLTQRKPEYSFAEWREGDQKYYVSDISKAQVDLGWEPQIAFDSGLRDLIKWAESVS
ncbi:MAG: NAD-dependent epimerase/dehydratase family protein [Chloroflexi bacterium]|nr:MAG: NAD-dependent epimerase/dehydratase family protein [Chloroflexota bacterium]